MPPWSKDKPKDETSEAPSAAPVDAEGGAPSGGPSEEEVQAATAAQAEPPKASEPGASLSVTVESLAVGLHATGCDVSGAAEHALDSHSGSIVRDYRERAERLFSALS